MNKQIFLAITQKLKTILTSRKNREVFNLSNLSSSYNFAPFLTDYTFLSHKISQQQYNLAYIGWILKCMRFGETLIEPVMSYEKQTEAILSDGRVIRRIYDELRRLKTIICLDKTEVHRDYDERGNPSTISHSKGSIKYHYDVLDQLNKIAYPDGKVISFTRDSVGNLECITYSNGESVFYHWDANNKLIGVADSSVRVEYQRDKLGNLINVTYPREIKYPFNLDEKVTAFSLKYNYNNEGKISTIISPFGISQFDNFGNILSKIDINGQKTLFRYTQNGQLKYIESPFGITVFEYDSIGKPITIIDPWGMKSILKYDSQGHIEEVMDNFGIGRCEYDKQGNLCRIIRNGKEKFKLNYTSNNQIKSIDSLFGTIKYVDTKEIFQIVFPRNSKVGLQYRNNALEKIAIPYKMQFLNLVPFLEILVFPKVRF